MIACNDGSLQITKSTKITFQSMPRVDACVSCVRVQTTHTNPIDSTQATGLKVFHADLEGPLVSGFFALATEDPTDEGTPHTLEHLCFLGSERYPYKGVLDQLANRAFSDGTNAWTGTDHTAYTIECAGSDGFLQMLPIYLVNGKCHMSEAFAPSFLC